MIEKKTNFFTSLTKIEIQSLMQAIKQGRIDGVKWRTTCWIAYQVLKMTDLDEITVCKISGLSMKDIRMLQYFGDEDMLEYFGDEDMPEHFRTS